MRACSLRLGYLATGLFLLACQSSKESETTRATAAPAASTAPPANLCPDADPNDCAKRAAKELNGSGGVEMNVERAIALYRASCDRGAPDGCAGVGMLTQVGHGSIEQNTAAALALFEKSCELGSADGCGYVAGLRLNDIPGVPQEKDKAVSAIKKMIAALEAKCNAKETAICLTLGDVFEEGREGVPADAKRAAKLREATFKMAEASCKGGNAEDCNVLGVLHEHGEGTTKNPSAAATLYKKACDAKDADGCTNLGIAHYNGTGVEKDLAKAIALTSQACEQGNSRGCYVAGVVYNDEGPTQDLTKAASYFEQGCRRLHGIACNELGAMHSNGTGDLKRDKQRALELYTRACNLLSSVACENAEHVREHLAAEGEALSFRESLKIGSDSHCGLVVEVKPPIVKVQSMIGEVWLKIEQLYPKGKQACKFHNGEYVEP